MRKIGILFLLICSFTIVYADLLDTIVSGGYRPKGILQMQSMSDGIHYTQLKEKKYIIKYNYKTGKAMDTLFDATKTKLHKLVDIVSYKFSPDEKKILVYRQPKYQYRRSFVADYYLFNVQRNELTPLSNNGQQSSPLFSPDSRYIAFARKNNLFLYKIDFGTESSITNDGQAGSIINGVADWVYEEEFGQTRYFEFSPDSKLLAFVRFDETNVPTYTMQRYTNSPIAQDHLPLYPTGQLFKYPKAGQSNSKVSVCVYDDFYKSVKTIQLSTTESDFYIPRIRWTATAEKLAIFTLNRQQNQLDVYLSNPKSLVSKLILTEKEQTYYDYSYLDAVKFSSDNQCFTFVSERDGYRHVYLYDTNGILKRQLTKGKWDVTKVYGWDDKTETLYYQSAENTPLGRSVYTIDKKGRKRVLTKGDGVHQVYFSDHYLYFVDNFSTIDAPNTFVLYQQDGKKIRILENNSTLKKRIEKLGLPQKTFFQFTNPTGIQLNGWMLKPNNVAPNKQYPLLMVQYSGPDSQQVLDQWSFGWEYFLAQQGYIVVSVDGRGTGARGSAFRKSTYGQLGVKESQDQIATAQYLSKLPYVDKDNIAIWGWSYGGYMTLLSMSMGEQQLFKAGIAIAPVTDWRLYNTAYTERFMKTPQENSAGYDAGSVIKHAKDLKGNVLLIHGTADDNVHIQNTYLYLEALEKANKYVDMLLYTDKNHSILGKQTRMHLYRRQFNFLESQLK